MPLDIWVQKLLLSTLSALHFRVGKSSYRCYLHKNQNFFCTLLLLLLFFFFFLDVIVFISRLLIRMFLRNRFFQEFWPSYSAFVYILYIHAYVFFIRLLCIIVCNHNLFWFNGMQFSSSCKWLLSNCWPFCYIVLQQKKRWFSPCSSVHLSVCLPICFSVSVSFFEHCKLLLRVLFYFI